MKLFKIDNYKLVIEPEVLLLAPFKKIWNNDKSSTKNRAFQELGYIYYMCDDRSDYKEISSEDKRSTAIKEGEGLPEDWKPSKDVLNAIEFYKQFETASSKMLNSLRNTLNKMSSYLDEIDYSNLDVKELSIITATADKVPNLIKKTKETERLVLQEIEEQGRARGGNDKSLFDDGFNI